MPQKKLGGWRRLVELLIPPLNVRLSAQMSGGPGPGQVVGSHHLNILFSATKCQRARAIPGKYFCSDHSGFQFRRTTDQTTCKLKCFNFSCCLPQKCRHIFSSSQKNTWNQQKLFFNWAVEDLDYGLLNFYCLKCCQCCYLMVLQRWWWWWWWRLWWMLVGGLLFPKMLPHIVPNDLASQGPRKVRQMGGGTRGH